MRELRFRAWDEGLKRYFYDVTVYPNNIVAIQRHNIESMMLEAEYGATHWTELGKNAVIEQYTGLKDKNGKEIYEGDIVEQFVCGVKKFKGQKCGRRTIWQVRWNEEECCFELHYLSGSLFGDSMMSNSDEYEVIGNIHENRGLLEEEEE